jgi:hypothetical protein
MMSDSLRVLIGCEYSGAVREEFRRLGHDAWSCDLLQSDDGSEFHEVRDVFEMIESREWDIAILHPPCTALAVSGNAHYGRGMAKEHLRGESIKWTMDLWELATLCCNHVALENPVGVLSNHIPVKPSYIQPYEFGHPESKRTGLWLHGLPALKPTQVLTKPACGYWENQTPSGQNKLSESKDRWKLRSKTYSGVAAAMADQWSEYVLNN